MHLRRKDSNNANSFFTDFSEFSENKFRIEDFFDIKVGPVVPFRLENKGNWYPFVNCSKTNWWDRNLNFSKIRFNGKVFKPPFVVIRRTSSPSENYRAIAAIITGKENIAVENHLLVLMPKDNKIETCRELMVRLKDKRTNDWLNNRIRCRHLTVSSVSKLPWWE